MCEAHIGLSASAIRYARANKRVWIPAASCPGFAYPCSRVPYCTWDFQKPHSWNLAKQFLHGCLSNLWVWSMSTLKCISAGSGFGLGSRKIPWDWHQQLDLLCQLSLQKGILATVNFIRPSSKMSIAVARSHKGPSEPYFLDCMA